jgi:hypothetical protein
MAFYSAPRQYKGRRGTSRLEQMQADGQSPPMPPVPHEAGYLIKYLIEVGPVMGTGMGAIPLTFGELQAWQQQTGLDLRPWEAATLRRLSRDYAGESIRAANPAVLPPWRPPVLDRAQVNEQVRAIFGALVKRPAQAAGAKA